MRREVNIWRSVDWMTVLLYLILIAMGWINIYAAVFDERHQSIVDLDASYGRQLIWITFGLVLALIVFVIDTRFYMIFAYAIYGFFILLLLSVLIFGKEVNGARSWFEISNFRLQPAEFAKFATALALAKFLSSHNLKIHTLKNLGIMALMMLVPAGLILVQNDTGSAVVYIVFILVMFREGLSAGFLFLIAMLGMLFFASLIYDKLSIIIVLISLAHLGVFIIRQKLKESGIALAIQLVATGLCWAVVSGFNLQFPAYGILVTGLIISIPVYVFLILRRKIRDVFVVLIILVSSVAFTFTVDIIFHRVLEPHQRNRINDVLGIQSDLLGTGYNVHQSKIAIGSGGLLGKGFLQGTQTKYNFVPEQSTDFIFCTVGEEWGFVGTTAVLLLFMTLMLRLIFLAERQRSQFSRIFGYCVVCIILFHVTVNIGMTLGIAPVIGIPLPFFSYGGSSLWAFTILLFVFLRLDATRMELLK